MDKSIGPAAVEHFHQGVHSHLQKLRPTSCPSNWLFPFLSKTGITINLVDSQKMGPTHTPSFPPPSYSQLVSRSYRGNIMYLSHSSNPRSPNTAPFHIHGLLGTGCTARGDGGISETKPPLYLPDGYPQCSRYCLAPPPLIRWATQ